MSGPTPLVDSTPRVDDTTLPSLVQTTSPALLMRGPVSWTVLVVCTTPSFTISQSPLPVICCQTVVPLSFARPP